MPETAKNTGKEAVERLLSSLLDAGIDALKALVGHDLTVHSTQMTTLKASSLVAQIGGQHAVVRGQFDGDSAGEIVRCVIPAAEATKLAGYVMMSPPEVIAERHKSGLLGGEELEAFAEVANVLCSSFDSLLREHGGEGHTMRAADHGVVEPGLDQKELLGSAPLVGLSFDFSIDGEAHSTGWLLVDTNTADRWSGSTLDLSESEDDSEEIEAAPIRGKLTAYVVEPDLMAQIRKSCRRVGLELDRRARTEVPNPAEHKDGIVLIDVPSGDSRRFEWCKRLKAYQPAVQVAVLIHHPSRSRVLQGFLAKADAIMGWPITERELSQRLGSMLDVVTGAAAPDSSPEPQP